MLTERDIAKALEKCKVLHSYIDDEDKTAVVLDGYFDLARAARLLNRLERARRNKEMGRYTKLFRQERARSRVSAVSDNYDWLNKRSVSVLGSKPTLTIVDDLEVENDVGTGDDREL